MGIDINTVCRWVRDYRRKYKLPSYAEEKGQTRKLPQSAPELKYRVKEGQNVGISCDNMSINGFMVSPAFSSTVYTGKKAIDEITVFSSDLEDNGITSVDDIELSFEIYDTNTYQTITTSGRISFTTK